MNRGWSQAMPGGVSSVDRVTARSASEEPSNEACDVCAQCQASPRVWARRERACRALRAWWCTWRTRAS